MFRFIKKHPRLCMLLADATWIPLWIGFYFLSDYLLTNTDSVCDWTRWGGQCLTCGGTHFVKEFLSFHFAEAWEQNELLFFIAIYTLLTLLVVNLLVVFRWRFAKTILKCMYNIPVLILFIAGAIVFFLVRNVPAVFKWIDFINYKVDQIGGWSVVADTIIRRFS